MKKASKKEKKSTIVKQVKQENPVYLKLRYNESLQSKKNLLIAETSLIKIMKIIKRYNLFRLEELRLKSELYRVTRDLNSSVKRTKSVFPFLEIPEKLRRKELARIEPLEEAKEEPFDEDLENQLAAIQEKLRVLSE